MDEKKLIRREVVTRVYKIRDPFDFLVPTRIKPRLRMYELVEDDIELLSKPGMMESVGVVNDESEGDAPSKLIRVATTQENATADNASVYGLRELAERVGPEDVTTSMPQRRSRRLGKLIRRDKSS